jgi:hypothetical protein
MNLYSTLAASLFGYTAPASGSDPASAIALLKRATAPGATAKGVAHERKDPVVITALAQFDKALAAAKDVKSALGDPRVLAVLLPGVGLADQMAYPGLAQRALVADPTAKKGILTQVDAKWKAAATTLGIFGKGLDALKDPALVQKLKDNYVAYQYQKGLDAQQPGMSDALYFIGNAAAKADNVYNVMGDGILRRVVTGSLELPQELAVQPIQDQAKAITNRLPMDRLKDPQQVYRVAQRYLMVRAQNPTANTTPDIATLAASLRV